MSGVSHASSCAPHCVAVKCRFTVPCPDSGALRSELRSTHGFFKMKMCVFAQSGTSSCKSCPYVYSFRVDCARQVQAWKPVSLCTLSGQLQHLQLGMLSLLSRSVEPQAGRVTSSAASCGGRKQLVSLILDLKDQRFACIHMQWQQDCGDGSKTAAKHRTCCPPPFQSRRKFMHIGESVGAVKIPVALPLAPSGGVSSERVSLDAFTAISDILQFTAGATVAWSKRF